MEIYKPAEDSIMFAEFLKKYLSKIVPTTYNLQPTTPTSSVKMLDMGTGSGILAKTALKFLSPKK